MSSAEVERTTKKITCPKCGASGEATLQRGTATHPEIKVISVTKEFAALETKTLGTEPGFMCQQCRSVVH